MNRRLYRSPDDRVLAGVAGGMAETYDFDPALVRIGWALLILVTGGVFLLLYIVMALVVPLRPAGMMPWSAADVPPAPGTPYSPRKRTRRSAPAFGILRKPRAGARWMTSSRWSCTPASRRSISTA